MSKWSVRQKKTQKLNTKNAVIRAIQLFVVSTLHRLAWQYKGYETDDRLRPMKEERNNGERK